MSQNTAEEACRGLLQASEQHDPRPRPQMIREHFVDLSGVWEFAYDDTDAGEAEHWESRTEPFDLRITVPFPPESAASGIGDTGFHDVIWYRRELSAADLQNAGHDKTQNRRVLLHFGAVDYRCSVWLNGTLLGRHEGGHTPFSFDIQNHLVQDSPQVLVVRAEDRAADVAQPRGKQDWQREPHIIWYHRTSGIWQQVWLESTPALAIEKVHWRTDVPTATVIVEVRLNRPAPSGTPCRVSLRHGDTVIGGVSFDLMGDHASQTISVPALTNGQGFEELLWSPESPSLIDATVELLSEDTDAVACYFGIRSATVAAGHFLLNDRPYYIRSVLSQGYWPTSHLAAPTALALRDEVELMLSLGFNSARVHQKIEDPRFLYWADKLGLTLWGEAPAAFEFSTAAIERTTREWLDTLDRDRSHPSIITWVPLNESWGIQQIAHDAAQLNFARSMVALTKAIDPTRPVISNDGWEHANSDIVTIHDYDDDADRLAKRYGDDGLAAMRDGMGPAGRRVLLDASIPADAPCMLTEFGGVRFSVSVAEAGDNAWGYSTATSAQGFDSSLASMYGALQRSPWLVGTCYTQLTDTLQEANGLVTEDRIPKIDAARIRAIVMGASGGIEP